ncbi:MAG: hypothetical protein GF355_11905 [Candidatus Eisenbacteria bacterium]|nr:hypothetical protein [Candidatus Eisenbacteria bacterium]
MSVMAFRPRKARRQVNLNVTPLIDVLFLFIIFFVLTGTFKRIGEMELQLPEATTAAAAERDERAHEVELVATEAGATFVDGEAVPLPELKRRLAEILNRHPQSRVTIKAEEGVRHGRVVLLLDIVRDAGFPGVGIGTHIKSGADGAE